ncbi:hypothetical protein [Methylibium sp.]|uniref:hypothetical protein n=1 Tax=Methylibium sp. TaxID=2067992 RepID=UPI003D09DDD8
MTRPALVRLLIAQTVLLVLVGWAGVYFGRDEYLLATAKHLGDDEESLAKAPAAIDVNGVPTVRLSAAARRNVGIEVAAPEPAEFGAETDVPVLVLDAQPLAELQGRLRAARHEAEGARAQAAASAAERQRVQALYDDDHNASQRALEAATAQAATDAARARAAQAQLAALHDSALAAWGPALTRELDGDGPGPVARLASGRDVLLRAMLRGDAAVPPGARLMLSLAGRKEPLAAAPLGASGAGATGESGGGRSLLFRTQGSGLVPGQRLSGQLHGAGARQQTGVLVPASAVVWHTGQPWIYIDETNEPQDVSPPASGGGMPAAAPKATRPRDGDDDDRPTAAGAASLPAAVPASAPPAPAAAADDTHSFQRRAVPHARRIGEQWFLPGFAEDDAVVVRGAQVLLSEELKFQIRNENDD